MKFMKLYIIVLMAPALIGAVAIANGKMLIEANETQDAVYSSAQDRILVADGKKGLLILDGNSGDLIHEIDVQGTAKSIQLANDMAYVLSRLENNEGVVTIIDPIKLVVRDIISVGPLNSVGPVNFEYAIAVFSDDLIALVSSGNLVAVQVSTGKVVRLNIFHFMRVYAPIGLDIRGDQLFLPSAYPGEIIILNVKDIDNITIQRRVPVRHSWLHEVKLINEERALVSGHAGGGVGIVNLATEKYTHISEQEWSYVYIEDKVAFAIAGKSLQKIDLESLLVETSTLPNDLLKEDEQFGHLTRILGTNNSGKLIILIKNKGIGLINLD